MARRRTGGLNGLRFLGNISSKKEVHDLDNEKTGKNQCQIDEIIAAGHAREYVSLALARAAGLDPCDKCLDGSAA